MKFLLFLSVLALAAGGLFHAELAQFISELAGGTAGTGSAVQSMGESGRSLMNSVGNAF